MRSSIPVTKVEGQIDNVEFTIKGPPEIVASIIKYIRNLTNFTNNKHNR